MYTCLITDVLNCVITLSSDVNLVRVLKYCECKCGWKFPKNYRYGGVIAYTYTMSWTVASPWIEDVQRQENISTIILRFINIFLEARTTTASCQYQKFNANNSPWLNIVRRRKRNDAIILSSSIIQLIVPYNYTSWCNALVSNRKGYLKFKSPYRTLADFKGKNTAQYSRYIFFLLAEKEFHCNEPRVLRRFLNNRWDVPSWVYKSKKAVAR